MRTGGAGANAALAFAEAGLRVRLIGLHRRRSARALDAGAARAVRAGRRAGRARRGGQRADRRARVPGARPHVPHVPGRQRGVGAVDDPGRRAGLRPPAVLRLLRRARAAGRGGAGSARRGPRRRRADVLRHRLGPGQLRAGDPGAAARAAAVRSTCSCPTRRRRARSPACAAGDALAAARSLQARLGRLGGGQARRARDASRSVPAARSCRCRPRRRRWPTRPARATRSTPG